MRKPLRLLLVADADAAPEIVTRDLAASGWPAEVVRVANGAELAARVEAPPAVGAAWDAVLADEASRLGPYGALEIVRRSSEALPVVVVRHSVDDAAYVDAIPAVGNPAASRLVRALEQALHEKTLRAEHHELRERLVVAERLAAVGFLVAGVAHEINNPLSAVIANHEFVRGELHKLARAGHDVSEAIDALSDIADGAAVIRQVVRDLRAFSRKEPGDELVVLNPRTIIESALRMAWHEIRGRARLVRELDKVPLVRANDARLSQVFLNLLINAAHAIPPGDAVNHAIHVSARTNAGGDFVAEVRDDGCGIAEEHLPFIFDAYFTTKPAGRGTGLGLAVSHRIIESLGGEMRVESELGKGSTFTVILPGATVEEPEHEADDWFGDETSEGARSSAPPDTT